MPYFGMVNWEALSVRELLTLMRRALVELRARGVVRTDNSPLGDVAEHVVRAAFGGTLAVNSGKSFDLVDGNGRRVQVKSRSILTNRPGSQLFSPFRSFDFDIAVFLVFDRDSMDLLKAVEVDAAAVRSAAVYKSHVNGWTIGVGKVLSAEAFGSDVSETVQEAYSSL